MAKVHDKAQAIEKYLQGKEAATVQQIAKEFELAEQEVVDILDSHHVSEDGKVTNEGPGKGGGWHPARKAQERRDAELAKALAAEGGAPATEAA